MKKLCKMFLAALLIAALVISFVSAAAAQDYIDIPDPNFAAAVREHMGLPENAPIPRARAAEVTGLDLYNLSISSLAGIEYFTALERLWASSNQLTVLDVSNNLALVNLVVGDNQLTTLDVSNNHSLLWLSVDYNQLTSLVLSNNPEMFLLIADNNELTSVDLSGAPALELIFVNNNNLITLDISRNLLLEGLVVYNNNLTMLDISNHPDMWLLYVFGNRMESPDDVIGWQDAAFLVLGQSFLFHAQQGAPPPLPLEAILEEQGASDWAVAEIVNAILLDLLPRDLVYDLQADITRAEFCRTAVQTLMAQVGHAENLAQFISDFEIDLSHEPFTDTSDQYIKIAYALGVVTGLGDGRFAPDNPITRQEAAVMLSRAAAVIEPDLFFVNNPTDFADASYFADWAREGIGFVSANNIMRGIGDNRFDPHGHYTREQSFVTMLRLFNSFPVG